MVQTINICKCDRCQETNDNLYKLRLEDGEVELCDKCYKRFQQWWNEYLKPDPFNNNIPFKPNENIMYRNIFGIISDDWIRKESN